ncbi:MAG TPA: carbon starvation CstA family protein [Planctomycetota bacterium]|nr:carbon starvation CstA family protein [Planctomycetota bacterium]
MSLPLLALLVLGGLALGYHFYGRFIARQFRLDDATPTPAQQVNDGVDFVPAKPFYLLGQHFSAIAAAGPIVGPIAACQAFGWLPCILWIALGAVFIGAVHDFSALVASVRHKARSIAEIVRQNVSRRAWLCLLAFIWIALVYVIVAFTEVTAGTFLGRIEELQGVKVGFERGGAVAFSSIAYLALAIVMGLIQRKWSPPLWLMTIVFVPATLGVVWLGTKCSTIFVIPGPNAHRLWGAIILGYCFLASLLPVWTLLQPRGYLGGFILYIVLAVGVIGIFLGGFAVQQPAFLGWVQTDPATGAPTPTGMLFPFLFVTIACGACSGFHGLVCGGTTSKQIAKETDCRPVGYGAMVLEAFVALVALATIMIALPKAGTPAGAVYGEGIGRFLTVIIGEKHLLFAIVFGSMAFSTFVFDTLDVATRLGRYILQELFDAHSMAAAALATLATVGVPLLFVLAARKDSWLNFWVLFGSSNQLLAALSLLGITVWLHRSGRAWWYTAAPMAFVMIITLWALGRQSWTGLTAFRAPDGTIHSTILLNGVVALALISLTGVIVLEAVRAIRRPAPAV